MPPGSSVGRAGRSRRRPLRAKIARVDRRGPGPPRRARRERWRSFFSKPSRSCSWSSGGVPGGQLHRDFVAGGLLVGAAVGLHLDVRKNFGAFEILQEFYFGLVGFGADGQLDLRAAIVEFGRNIDDAHSGRQDLFEIHKDFGPGEAALADEGIQKRGAIQNLFGLGGLKIGLWRGLLFAIDANFALPAGNFGPQVAAGAPGSVGGMAQQHEYEQANDAQGTRSGKERPLVV